MKKKSIVLIAVLATVITIAGCGSPAGKSLENKTEAEESGAIVIQDGGVKTTESMQTSEEVIERQEMPDSEASDAIETIDYERLNFSAAEGESAQITQDAVKGNSGDILQDVLNGNSEQGDQWEAEETDSISEYFTNEQLDHIRQALGIPDDLPVKIEIGDPYYWEGGDMDLIQIDFYHEGEFVAGAAFKPFTEEMARNIYQYSE